MVHKNIPLRILSLQVCPYDSESPLAYTSPGEELFDERSCFATGHKQQMLGVLLRFANRRALYGLSAPGVRRAVEVTLTDASAARELFATTLSVCMQRGEKTARRRVDLPFSYTAVSFDHVYRLSVRDERSGQMLGEREIRLFDSKYGDDCIRDVFGPAMGGLLRPGGRCYYKAMRVRPGGCYRVGFRTRVVPGAQLPYLPEMEVRVHYADGSSCRRFSTPSAVDLDACLYEIAVPFSLKRVQCEPGYAELLCMNVPIAGFAFRTDVDDREGSWSGDKLECIGSYTPQAYLARYWGKEQAGRDDVFHKMMEEFLEERRKEMEEEGLEIDPLEEEEALEFPDEEDGLDLPDEDEASDADDEDEVSDSTDEDAETARNGLAVPSDELLLSDLTGLRSVKEKLATYEKIVRFNKMRRDHNLVHTLQPLHAMFLGSPGTGKTTVAKTVGRMLHEAGVLSRGHVVEKQRANLLGPHYSEEETNTLEAIKDAQGGILFIDEAYQLYQPDDPRDPGRFVIETLMTALADERKRDWMLILAGYPDEMRRMFDMNPGLRSRIPESNIYFFDDFTAEELMEIAQRYLARNSYCLSPDAQEALAFRFEVDYGRRDKQFGNARYVINLIQTEILPAMAQRVVAQRGEISAETLTVIQAADIPMPCPECGGESNVERPRIGFHL